MQQDINYKVLTAVSEIKETLTLQKKVWGDSVAAPFKSRVSCKKQWLILGAGRSG